VIAGDAEARVGTVAGAERAAPGALTFLDAPPKSAIDLAGVVCIAPTSLAAALTACAAVIAVRHPRRAFALAAPLLLQPLELEPGAPAIHPDARVAPGAVLEPGCVVGPGAAIGAGTRIGANAVIGAGVQVGRGATIGACASLRCTLVGDGVHILAGARIGECGFGLAPGPGAPILTPHFGRVIVQDNASIGANCTIDRGLFADTVIGEGAQIDNLSHVGHNCRIGAGAVMAAFAGISGSVTIGDGAMLGGRSGVADHLRIGTGSRLGAGAAVMNDVPDGETWAGYPAKPIKAWLRDVAWLGRESQKRGPRDR
jgi:UDP-3-O-[3-hydroxymyristoyl] glucosamine N-acyltransferase